MPGFHTNILKRRNWNSPTVEICPGLHMRDLSEAQGAPEVRTLAPKDFHMV